MYCILLFVTVFLLVCKASTPLDDFIAAPDPWYSFVDTGITYNYPEFTGYLINMTSQQWLNSSYVNRPIWRHWLLVIIPKTLKFTDFAYVVAEANTSGRQPIFGEPEFDRAVKVARSIEAMVAVLYDVPISPLIFVDDPLQEERSGDEIVAFGWKMFSKYNSSDNFRYNWLPHFPMAKAHVKAMDTIETWASEKFGYNITRFAISGNSPRGWSTWLTAAADTRVVAFFPLVMDMVHTHPNLHHMWRAYGGWSWAWEPFYEENITLDLDSEWLEQLFEACDPYYFFDRYSGVHKLVVTAINDAYTMPDDANYWWSELPEPKYLLLLPEDANEMLYGRYVYAPNVATLITSYLMNITLPKAQWTIHNLTGTIDLTIIGNVSSILNANLWIGRTCGTSRRDFRLVGYGDNCCGINLGNHCSNLESFFVVGNVTSSSCNDTVCHLTGNTQSIPLGHWVGFFLAIQVHVFDSNSSYFAEPRNEELRGNLDESYLNYGHLFFTTEMSIVPQTFPFVSCNGTSCYGSLV